MPDREQPGLVGVLAPDWVYTRPAISLQNVSHHLPPKSVWTWKVGNSTPIDAKRNEVVEDFLAKPHLRWLCFLDADQVHPATTVPRLLSVLEAGADVSCGLYVGKTGGEMGDAAIAGHVTNLPDEAPDLRPTDHPEFQYRTLDLGRVPEAGVVEVDVAGTGSWMASREAIEALADEGSAFVANREHNRGLNEDYNACLRLKRMGYRIAVDTRLQSLHVGAAAAGVEDAKARHARKQERERQSVGIVG